MDELSAVLLALYSAARRVATGEFQDLALALIRPITAFNSAAWGTGRVKADGAVLHSVHLVGDPPDRLIDYEEVKDQDVAVFTLKENPGRALIFHAPTLYRGPGHTGIREYAKRWKHQSYLLASRLDEDSGLIQWLGLYRSNPDEQYEEKERRALEILFPHLNEALTLNRLIQLESDDSSSPYGTAIADRFGVLHHTDRRFAELVRHEWPKLGDRTLAKALTEHLRTCPGKRYVGCSIVVCIRAVRDLFFLKAREKEPIDRLTPRQRAVAAYVAEGLHYKEIARRLGLSPSTVRNYTQAIHERLDVRTNAELACLFITSTQ